MEEYEQLKRRADYIEEQLADLESARKAPHQDNRGYRPQDA